MIWYAGIWQSMPELFYVYIYMYHDYCHLSSGIANAAQDSDQQPGESSEEDEVGRSGAFGPKKSLQHQTHATAQHQQPQKRKKGKKRQAGSNQQQL